MGVMSSSRLGVLLEQMVFDWERKGWAYWHGDITLTADSTLHPISAYGLPPMQGPATFIVATAPQSFSLVLDSGVVTNPIKVNGLFVASGSWDPANLRIRNDYAPGAVATAQPMRLGIAYLVA